jgi:hypothetical protein
MTFSVRRRTTFRSALVCLLAIVTALAVSACGSMLESRVTRFHTLDKPTAAGYGTYFLYTPEERRSSLEFASYAALVKKELNARRFSEGAPGEPADLLVSLEYKVGPSGSSSTAVYAPRASGNSAFARGFNASGGAFATTEDEYLRVVLLRLIRMKGVAEPTTVFEAQVSSTGSTRELPVVMPTLIRSIFTEFPGKSGETTKVVLPVGR